MLPFTTIKRRTSAGVWGKTRVSRGWRQLSGSWMIFLSWTQLARASFSMFWIAVGHSRLWNTIVCYIHYLAMFAQQTITGRRRRLAPNLLSSHQKWCANNLLCDRRLAPEFKIDEEKQGYVVTWSHLLYLLVATNLLSQPMCWTLHVRLRVSVFKPKFQAATILPG